MFRWKQDKDFDIPLRKILVIDLEISFLVMAHHHETPHCACHSCHHEHHGGDDHPAHGHHGEHEHEHHHEHGSWRGALVRIVAAAVLLAVAMCVEHTCRLPLWQLLLIYLVPYLIVGWGTLREAAEGLAHGDAFNEHFLMALATIGALAIGFLPGAGTEFAEAVFVMLFFQVGELFEGYAEGKSRASIAHLMDIRPDTATVLRDAVEHTVAPAAVEVGETIVIRPGERVALDGVVIDGASALNTVALTGESVPRDVAPGDEVISGCVNVSGLLKVRTTKPYGESTVSKILRLVENADEHKSRSEAFITRFARIYTPIVTLAAVALAVLPPLLSGQFSATFPTWFYRALMFLVVSCPCALVLSVPLTFFGGIGAASRRGILIKGSNFIDALDALDTVVFDKTGTLTRGEFAVTAVHPDTIDEHHLLHLAAHVEHYSTHPIGAALRAAFPGAADDDCVVTGVEEVAGEGIRALVGDDEVCVGNTRMMDAVGALWHDCDHCRQTAGTVIHVAINGRYAGHIAITDQVKTDSSAAVERLQAQGVHRIVMLTGDRQSVADAVAQQLGIAEYYAGLLPADKVMHVEQLLAESPDGRTLAMAGDGINDAPVLARADVGIAMGGLGSDAAIEAADVVLMDDSPLKISEAVAVARRTLRIAWQNVALAVGVKLVVLILAACGLATMWMAVFADVGVTVLAVLNAMRTLRPTKWNE